MGKRLGELTRNSTKCMVKVDGKRLIEYALDALAAQGIRKAVGWDVSLQLDPNGLYTDLDEAAQVIRACAPSKVDVFEDILEAPFHEGDAVKEGDVVDEGTVIARLG